jgi:hypothetical protein
MEIIKTMNRPIKATNDSLNELFKDIDVVQIKSDGVYEDKALSDDVVLRIEDPSVIQTFKELIAIEKQQRDYQCMCLGDYAIELLKEGELKSIIGFHHGISIRYSGWTGDAELKYADELLTFFFALGLKEPLEKKKRDNDGARK